MIYGRSILTILSLTTLQGMFKLVFSAPNVLERFRAGE